MEPRMEKSRSSSHYKILMTFMWKSSPGRIWYNDDDSNGDDDNNSDDDNDAGGW